MGGNVVDFARVNAVLLPALRGYAGCGLAGAGAAVYCALMGASPELAAVLVPVAVAAGERLERFGLALWSAWRMRRGFADGQVPGSVIDTTGARSDGGVSVGAYGLLIKGYCGHDGIWRVGSVGCRSIGMAKAGGWWKAETLDGRIYDLDKDCWL